MNDIDRMTAPQPPAEAQAQGGGEVLDRGFKFESGVHTPTVLVGFAPNDWKARDAFAASITTQAAPPSAPVGVEGAFEEYHKADHRDPAVATEWEWWQAAWKAALAQQPAAVAPVGVEWPLSLLRAGHWREVYVGHRCMRLEVTYDHATWERLMEQVEAALAVQPGGSDND